MSATPEALEKILERLKAAGQSAEKIVVYLRQPDGQGRRPTDVAVLDENDDDYRDLNTVMVNATNAILQANFDDGLSEEDMDLSRALGSMQEVIVGLHVRRDRQTIENMFDAAKEGILTSNFLLSLPDATKKIDQLGLILDIHYSLALYQVDNPQPEQV